MKRSHRTFALVAGAATLLLAGACAHNEPAEQRQVAMSVEPSSHEIVAGETVTLVAKTENTLGRDASVKWTCIGGHIKTEEDGRIARVSFKDPGMYTVTARLYADGRVLREDAVDVRVKPLN